jgi:glycerol-3-phosphate dehydrogenase (NAD(P)+)
MAHVGVVGAGAWGTALAQVCASAGQVVTIWALESEVVTSIADTHENTLYLPGIALSPAITPTHDLGRMAEVDAVLAVVPAQFMRARLGRVGPKLHA